MRKSLLDGTGAEVACGECKACCEASYFIHIQPGETRTLDRIDPRLLFPAPGMPGGHVLMGHDQNGICPMLVGGKCSIYSDRPQTCRNYDCRVFSATGLEVGGVEKSRIQERVRKWRFDFPAIRDRQEHQALQATVEFIRKHAELFPGGVIPQSPSHLAILAVKTYPVLLPPPGLGGEGGDLRSDSEIADAIVAAAREFDARRSGSGIS